jgi:hypothetical protein
MVEKLAFGQLFLPVLLFPLSVSFHHCSILAALPEGRTGEDWEPSKKGMLFLEIGERWLERTFTWCSTSYFANA